MRVLVTGAAGMLGRDLMAHLSDIGDDPVGVDLDVDVRDRSAVMACVREVAPQAIIHCAAWTDVDGAERHEQAAHAVNAVGAGNVAAAARENGIPMVLPSTDYVFDGRSSTDYREDDEAAPLGAYGRTKLAGERAALDAHPSGARVARTAWLYGAGGRNFVDTMRRLADERDEVTVVADQVGSPTWTRDLAPALRALVAASPGIHHASGGGCVSWAGFAEAIFAELDVPCRVVPTTTAEFGRPAPRPARAVLAVTRPDTPRLRPWREALADYLSEIA